MLKQILTSLELFQTISWTAFFFLCHTFHPAALHKDLKKEKTCFLKQQLPKRLIPVMTSVLNSARKPRCESFVKVTWKNRMLSFLFALLVKQEAKDVSLFSLWIWCWFISLHGAKYDFFNFFLEEFCFSLECWGCRDKTLKHDVMGSTNMDAVPYSWRLLIFFSCLQSLPFWTTFSHFMIPNSGFLKNQHVQ